MIEARSGRFQVLLELEKLQMVTNESGSRTKIPAIIEARMVLYEADGANFFYPLAKADNDCNIN